MEMITVKPVFSIINTGNECALQLNGLLLFGGHAQYKEFCKAEFSQNMFQKTKSRCRSVEWKSTPTEIQITSKPDLLVLTCFTQRVCLFCSVYQTVLCFSSIFLIFLYTEWWHQPNVSSNMWNHPLSVLSPARPRLTFPVSSESIIALPMEFCLGYY